jgi:uncharacterized membrane protein (DUF373 family)
MPPRPETGVRSRSSMSKVVEEISEHWPDLNTYERFECGVSLVIKALIGAVIVVALVHLTARIGVLLLFGLADPLDHTAFQTIFGMILTVLIAVEFNHSLVSVLERRDGVVQVRTVLLIALLALVRKFIVLEVQDVQPLTLIGLALTTLALGGVYWLVRDQDRRITVPSEPQDE